MARREIGIISHLDGFHFDAAAVRALFATLDRLQPGALAPGELSIAFLDDAQVATLHQDYLGDPTPTDVITFPGDSHLDFAGEICLSVEHAAVAASKHGEPFRREICLYLVHGWLHLTGQDDHTAEERAEMRRQEAAILRALEAQASLPHFEIHED